VKESRINFKVGDEDLNGKLFFTDESKDCEIVSLHGAGLARKERIVYLLDDLAKRAPINAGIFDFSGHGESTGKLEESSLKKRVEEATAFLNEHIVDSPVVIGSSMGAYIAIKMLDVVTPETLILFCPALYSGEAYTVPFTKKFTEIIRKPNSWQNTDVLPLLQNFRGNLLVFIGTDDVVIPAGVIDLINENSNKVKKKAIVRIPNAPHAIHAFISEHPEVKEMVVAKVLEYIQK
jgi:pimeloyl-ACP methyl ester carboxylesterase